MEGNSPVCVALGAAWGIVVGPVGQAELRALGGPPEAGTVGLALPAPGAGDATRSDVPCSTGCTRVRCLLVKDARGGHPVRTRIGPLSVASSRMGFRRSRVQIAAPRPLTKHQGAPGNARGLSALSVNPVLTHNNSPGAVRCLQRPVTRYASYPAGDDGRRRREAARRWRTQPRRSPGCWSRSQSRQILFAFRVPRGHRQNEQRQLFSSVNGLMVLPPTGRKASPSERYWARFGRHIPTLGGPRPPRCGVWDPGGSVTRHPSEQSHQVPSAAISAKRPDRAGASRVPPSGAGRAAPEVGPAGHTPRGTTPAPTPILRGRQSASLVAGEGDRIIESRSLQRRGRRPRAGLLTVSCAATSSGALLPRAQAPAWDRKVGMNR